MKQTNLELILQWMREQPTHAHHYRLGVWGALVALYPDRFGVTPDRATPWQAIHRDLSHDPRVAKLGQGFFGLVERAQDPAAQASPAPNAAALPRPQAALAASSADAPPQRPARVQDAAPGAAPRAFVQDSQRVRFQDVDHAGIVFFAKIYEYCHVAYEDFIEQVVGYTPKQFFEENDFGAPLVATRSSHAYPLFHGDRLRIRCHVVQLGRSSMTMRYLVENGQGTLCAAVYTRHAFIKRRAFQAIPIPEDVRRSLLPYLDPEELSWS